MSKEKLIIYPFSLQFCPVLRHKHLLIEYEILNVISPSGWGLSDVDAGYADGGGNIGIIVDTSFENYIDLCDSVMFVEACFNINFEKLIYPKIFKAIECKKNIILALEVDSSLLKDIETKCFENGVNFKYYGAQQDKLPEYNFNRENILKIDTPIIFVMGMSENVNKFEIQLSLGDKITEAGYKVSQIGTRAYSSIFGFYNFPQFMYGNDFSESRKIAMFNRFVKNIESKDKPDVIIIGIPGGIMPINNEFTNRFGILAMEISMALKPDAVVLSIPYGDYSLKQYDKFAQFVNNRFGFNVDAINLSNVSFDWIRVGQGIDISYITIDSSFIDEKKALHNEFSIPIINVFNKNDKIMLSNLIMNKLTYYGEAQLI